MTHQEKDKNITRGARRTNWYRLQKQQCRPWNMILNTHVASAPALTALTCLDQTISLSWLLCANCDLQMMIPGNTTQGSFIVSHHGPCGDLVGEQTQLQLKYLFREAKHRRLHFHFLTHAACCFNGSCSTLAFPREWCCSTALAPTRRESACNL